MSRNESQRVPQPEPSQAVPEEAPHKPADDREVIYFEGSPLLRGDVAKLMMWGLFAALALAGAIYAMTKSQWIVGLALVVLALIFMGIPWLATRTLRYRISNYRIDFERGILSKNIDTLELWHVEDISFHQGLVDRMLNVGTITVISHDDTTPELAMHGIPDPRPLFENLKQRIIAVKRQRGVIKMDVGS